MIRGFFLAIILVVLGYGLGFLLFLSLLPHVPDSVPHADGIVALTGGGERLDTADALFERNGVGKRLLISGVDLTTTKATLKEMVHGGRRFDCCVDLGYAAEDTHGNAVETAGWARSYGFKSLVIVTARYHMLRALREFASTMPGVRLEPYPVDEGSIDVTGWWRHLPTALLLQREYAKYLVSLVMTSVT